MTLKSFQYHFVLFLSCFFVTTSLTQADPKGPVDLIFTTTPLKKVPIKPSAKSHCQEDAEEKAEIGPIITLVTSTFKPEDVLQNAIHWVNFFIDELLTLYKSATGEDLKTDKSLQVKISFSAKDEQASYTHDENGGLLTLGYFPSRVFQTAQPHAALHAPEIAYHVAHYTLNVARPTGEKPTSEEKEIRDFLARYLSLQLSVSLFEVKELSKKFGSSSPTEDDLSLFLEGNAPLAFYKTGPFYTLLFGLWQDRYKFTSRNSTIWQNRIKDLAHLGTMLLRTFEDAEQLGWISFKSTLFWHFQSDPVLKPKSIALFKTFKRQGDLAQILEKAVHDLALGKIDQSRSVVVHGQKILSGPQLAQILYDKKQYGLALEVKTRKGEPALQGAKRANALYQKGTTLDDAKDFDGAAKALKEALETKGADKVTTCLSEYRLGHVLIEQKIPAEALPHFLRAFTHIDRRDSDDRNCLDEEFVLKNIALTYRAMGDHQNALVFWLKQERAFPGWQFFDANRYGTLSYPAGFVLETAEYFHRAGQFEDAIKRYETLVNLRKLETEILDCNKYPLDEENLKRARANLEKARRGELI